MAACKHDWDRTRGICTLCGVQRCRCGNRPYHKPECITIRDARAYALEAHDPYTGAWAGLPASVTDAWIDARYDAAGLA